uniref:Protein kinase domain-containing protein n=1 Tax=Echinostoma caproni TaxID=27848 RepID=A0A183AUV3_9TREM
LKMQGYQAACDVWSLGVIVYCMLIGQAPFSLRPDDRPEVILSRIDSGRFDTTRPEWSSLSDMAKDLVRRMLDPEPTKRYTASQVVRHPWVVKVNELPSEPVAKYAARDPSKMKAPTCEPTKTGSCASIALAKTEHLSQLEKGRTS